MNLICPQCNEPIGQDDFNVGTDIAYCRRCAATFSVAKLVAVEAVDDATYEDFERSCCEEWGHGRTATVPFRPLLRITGYVLLLEAIVMPTILGILLQDLMLDEAWLFIFVLAAFIIPSLLPALFFSIGKYVLRIEHGMLRVQTGVFPMQRTKQIELNRVTVVSLDKNPYFRVNNQPVEQVAVETEGRTLTFGIMLNKKNKACLVRWIAKHM